MIIRSLSTALLFCCFAAAPCIAQLKFDVVEQELEATAEDEEVVAEFAFENAGEEAVTITRIRSSCGCTVAELEKKTYEPGEEGTVTVTYKLERERGERRRQILVQTDRRDQRSVVLRLRVKVAEDEAVTSASN